MILTRESKPDTGIFSIDLTGYMGNALYLVGLARTLGHRVGYSEKRIKAFQKVMMMGDYEGMIQMLDKEFGEFVVFWR